MAAQGPTIGDRFPDFHRPAPDGALVGLYERLCGTPCAVVVGGTADAAAALAAAVAPLPCCAVLAGPQARALEGVLVVADDGAVLRACLGADAPTGQALFLLGSRMRVAARLDDPPADPAGLRAAVAAAAAAPAGEAPAPVLTVPGVLDDARCDALIRAWAADNDDSGMLRVVDGRPVLVADPSAKKRRDHSLADPALAGGVAAALERRVLPEIRRAFHYPVTRFERFKVVCYDAASGGYFRRHRDNTTPDAAHRRFALTLNLNTGDYEGGDLVFPEYGPERHAPPRGGALVFSCSLLHEATDVTRGRRFALLTFLYGDDTARRAR